MRDLKKQERTAIEAVARRFSATWEKGSDPPDAYLVVAGKRVAVDITTLKRRGTGQGNAAKPRLRFDKVVTRLMERLQATLGETVPDGMTVLLTITAPIRVPSKTAASLEDKIQTLLGRGSPGRDEKATIHGNRVRIRLSSRSTARSPPTWRTGRRSIGSWMPRRTQTSIRSSSQRCFVVCLKPSSGALRARRQPTSAERPLRYDAVQWPRS